MWKRISKFISPLYPKVPNQFPSRPKPPLDDSLKNLENTLNFYRLFWTMLGNTFRPRDRQGPSGRGDTRKKIMSTSLTQKVLSTFQEIMPTIPNLDNLKYLADPRDREEETFKVYGDDVDEDVLVKCFERPKPFVFNVFKGPDKNKNSSAKKIDELQRELEKHKIIINILTQTALQVYAEKNQLRQLTPKTPSLLIDMDTVVAIEDGLRVTKSDVKPEQKNALDGWKGVCHKECAYMPEIIHLYRNLLRNKLMALKEIERVELKQIKSVVDPITAMKIEEELSRGNMTDKDLEKYLSDAIDRMITTEQEINSKEPKLKYEVQPETTKQKNEDLSTDIKKENFGKIQISETEYVDYRGYSKNYLADLIKLNRIFENKIRKSYK